MHPCRLLCFCPLLVCIIQGFLVENIPAMWCGFLLPLLVFCFCHILCIQHVRLLTYPGHSNQAAS
eukprot:UN20202